MIRTSDAIQRIQQIVRSDHLQDEQVLALLQTRYEWLYDTIGWSMRRRELVISLVAQVESGASDTVTATLDSATVTSAGTPFTAAMDGRQIVLGEEVSPFFLTYVSTSVVTLQDGEGNAVVWPHATAAGLTWNVRQSLYALPAGADSVLWLGTDVPIHELDGGRQALNHSDPNRQTTDSQPTVWCHAGYTTGTSAAAIRRQIEVWPVPTTGRILRGEYQREAPILTATSIIDIQTPLIVTSAAADCFGALYALTGDEGHQKNQLFYERKANEMLNDYGPADMARQSLPTSFGLGRERGLGGDFLVNHNSLEDFE